MFTAQPLSRQYCTWRGDLLVGEIGQERKAALGNAHDPAPYIETLAVGTKSGVSVELVVEGDVLPDLQRRLQRRAGLRRLGQNFRALVQIVAAFVAGEDHRFQRDAVGGGAGLDAHRMADGAAAELQHHVLAEMIEQLMHLAGMDAARRHRHHLVEARPVLVEEHAVLQLASG